MRIFISYRHVDRSIATQISDYLQAGGFIVYLDIMDAEMSINNLTDRITNNIKESDMLFAVISAQTKSSWWVPFEIGEATMAEKTISVFKHGEADLPEYLKMWPIFEDLAELTELDSLKASSSMHIFDSRLQKGMGFMVNQKRSAKQNHDQLKQALRRRRA